MMPHHTDPTSFKKEQPQKLEQAIKKLQKYSNKSKKQKRPSYVTNSCTNFLNHQVEEASHASK